jgi:cytidine deaminase
VNPTDLVHLAREAAAQGYAPFSGFRVGAAVVMADDPGGAVHTGANVENASFGATVCAERVAVFRAVSLGFRRIAAVAVSAPAPPGSPLSARSPCGICRQVILEFATPETSVIIDNGSDAPDVLSIDALLPHGFRFGEPQTPQE